VLHSEPIERTPYNTYYFMGLGIGGGFQVVLESFFHPSEKKPFSCERVKMDKPFS